MSALESPESAGEGRPIGSAFVTALALALRRRGLTVTPDDTANCLALALERPSWRDDEIIATFQAVLAKRPTDAAAIRDVCAGLLAPPQPEERKLPPPTYIGKLPVLVTPERSVWKISGQWFRAFVGAELPGIGPAWRVYGPLLLAIVLVRNLADLVSPYGLIETAWQDLVGNFKPPKDREGRVEPNMLAVISIGAAVATVATMVSIVLWRGLRPRRRIIEEDDFASLPPPVRRELDASVFRVGLVGKPPDFLGEPFRTDIAALFGYRPGGPDRNRLDVAATVAAQIREADASLLHFAVRRELPTILTLVDSEAEGAAWNTLAGEFEALLRQRGIVETRIAFPGSFHRGLTRSAQLRPEALAVMDALAVPGWTVTVIFGEAHRISPRDRDLLAVIRENGPLLFLEMHDPALWDARHRALTRAGIDLRPATAAGLRDGLARIFAPHRGSVRAEAGNSGVTGPRRQHPAQTATEMLDRPHLDWASDCALVEPVSFGLAETLRNRYETLRTPLPNLAFSRLAALPGSWLGPEGLRFEPSVRRMLQSHFASRPRAEREKAICLIEGAFEAVTPTGLGSAAQTMRDYALNVARFVGLTSNEAWRELVELRRAGAMALGSVEDLFARVAYEENVKLKAGADANVIGGHETIALGDVPETAAMRDWLASEERRSREPAASAPGPIARRRLARWAMSVPDARLIYQRDKSADGVSGPSGAPLPIGGFVTGGRYLVIGSAWPVQAQKLHVLDLFSANPVKLGEIAGAFDTSAILTARDAGVAMAIDTARRAYLLALGEASLFVPDRVMGPFPGPGGKGPLAVESPAALSPDGRSLWSVTESRDQLVQYRIAPAGRIPDASEEPPLVIRMRAPISAILVESDETLLLGLASGAVFRHGLRDGASTEIAQFGGAIVALASSGPIAVADPPDDDAPGAPGLVVAATANGRLALTDGADIVEHQLTGRPLRIALFRDRPCLSRHDQPNSSVVSEHGQSVAVHYDDGGFDIYGLPDPAKPRLFQPMSLLEGRIRPGSGGPRVIAFGAQTRRVALYENERIVVRSLIYRPPVAEPQDDPEAAEPKRLELAR